MIADLLGVGWPVFLWLTVGLFGFCAVLAGQGLALAWRPAWTVVPTGIGMALADRFLDWALFSGPIDALIAFLFHAVFLVAVAALSHRATLARAMVRQYPWAYERTGLLTWKER